MNKRFNIWKARNMTLMGKIFINKCYDISNFVYSMTMMDT